MRYAFTMFCALFSTLVCGVGYMVSERMKPRSGMFRRWGSRWGRWLFVPAGLRVDATLSEDVSRLTPCVFVSNHQNAVDIPALLMALPVEFGFVAKASLSKVPVLGHAIAASPSVFVERRDPRLSHASMQTAAQTIRAGSSVLVFPEGERSYSTEVKSFKRSAFTLAAEAGVPVVPVTIHNAHELFDERFRVCRSGTVRITAGDSFRIPGTSRSDINDAASKAREIIVDRLEAPDASRHIAVESPVAARALKSSQ